MEEELLEEEMNNNKIIKYEGLKKWEFLLIKSDFYFYFNLN